MNSEIHYNGKDWYILPKEEYLSIKDSAKKEKECYRRDMEKCRRDRDLENARNESLLEVISNVASIISEKDKY